MKGSFSCRLQRWGLGALFLLGIGVYSAYAFIPPPRLPASVGCAVVRFSSPSPSEPLGAPPTSAPRYVAKPKQSPSGRRSSKSPSSPQPRKRPNNNKKSSSGGAVAKKDEEAAGGQAGRERESEAFRRVVAMEAEASERDYLEAFDICEAEGRPAACASLLRRMKGFDMPRPLSLYVRTMEVAVATEDWDSADVAFGFFFRREDVHACLRAAEEEQPGRGQAQLRSLLDMMLQMCEKFGKGGRAHVVFDKAQLLLSDPPDHYDWSLRVARACRRRQFIGPDDPSMPFVRTAFSPPPPSASSSLDLSTANDLLHALCRAKETTQALTYLTDAMPSLGIPPDEQSYATVLLGASQQSNASLALACLSHMCQSPTVSPTRRHVLQTIEAWYAGGAAGKQLKQAWDLYRPTKSRMVMGHAAVADPTAATVVDAEEEELLSRLLTTACNEGRADLVDALLPVLCDAGRFPPVNLRAVMFPLAKHGLPDQAEALLRLYLKHNVEQSVGADVGYSAVVAACQKAGQYERLLQWTAEMREKGIEMDELRYSMALKACERLGRWEEGLDLVQRMRRQGLPGNSLFWKRILLLLGREGRADEALALLYELREAGEEDSLPPLCYEAVITAYARRGDRQKAHKCLVVFEQQLQVELGKGAYTSAIAVCRANGGTEDGVKGAADWQAAMQLYHRMQSRGLELTSVTRAALLEVLLPCNRLEEAEAVVNEHMASGGAAVEDDLGLLPHVLELRMRLKQYDKAVEAFKLLVDLKQRLPDDRKNAFPVPWQICNTAVHACAKTGDVRLGLDTLELLRTQGMPVDMVMYGCVLGACGQSGAWREALELIRDMGDRGLRPNTVCYTSAITACQRAGEWRKALNLFLRMTSQGPPPDVQAYNAVMSACANAGEWQMALKVFQALQKQRALGEHKLAPNDVSYATAVVACWKGEQWRPAVEVLQAMKADGLTPNMITTTLVIDACERAGRADVAMYVFESTVVGAIRSECYDPAKDGPGMLVDLHGYTQMYTSRGQDPRVIKDFIFITGIGRHSANPFEPVLRPAMMAMLLRDFDPPLECEPVADNAGRLRVRSEELVKWIDAQMAPRTKAPSEKLDQGGIHLKSPDELAAEFGDWRQWLLVTQQDDPAPSGARMVDPEGRSSGTE